MKQSLLLILAVTIISTAIGQTKKDWSKVAVSGAGDHFMISMSKDGWSGTPDSINNRMGGFSRGLNIAFMLNKPFKSDARLSVAFGLGISHSSIFFKKTEFKVIRYTFTLHQSRFCQPLQKIQISHQLC